MLFDKDRIVVQAGKPVEIVFENTDLMPHNFVVTAARVAGGDRHCWPRRRRPQPGAAGTRTTCRSSPKILLGQPAARSRATRRSSSFTAPTKPGVYPYVCTYPGHWRRMYGALYVVEDLDEYLADPEAYLAEAPVADRRTSCSSTTGPRKEWKFEDLAAAGRRSWSRAGRSANGKQMFQVASCVACHKLNGVGNEFGPDLTKLDPKRQAPSRSCTTSSSRRSASTRSTRRRIFDAEDRQGVTGLILEETPDAYKVIENPLAKAEPVVIKKADIDTKTASKVSLMPKDLLDKLSAEEILDLVAYVSSGGDEQNKLFQGGHDHHH